MLTKAQEAFQRKRKERLERTNASSHDHEAIGDSRGAASATPSDVEPPSVEHREADEPEEEDEDILDVLRNSPANHPRMS